MLHRLENTPMSKNNYKHEKNIIIDIAPKNLYNKNMVEKTDKQKSTRESPP